MIWHSAGIPEVLDELKTNVQTGLSSEEAGLRLVQNGENRMERLEKTSFRRIYISQLKQPFFLLLAAVSVISAVTALASGAARWAEPLIVLAVVLLSALAGALRDAKTQEALASLNGDAAPSARVLRDGAESVIPASGLVEGDIILLEAGDYIPADARLLITSGFRCEESLLTGDAIPVQKDAHALLDDIAPLAARANMAYSGCTAAAGSARAVVVETGMDSELGKASSLLESRKATAPIQKRLRRLGGTLCLLVLVFCIVIFILGLCTGQGFFASLLLALSLGSAASPYLLPAAAGFALAVGAWRIKQNNIVIRRLSAVEKLRRVSVICTNKTGLLTQNKMEPVALYSGGKIAGDLHSLSEQDTLLLHFAALCSDAGGDPTEAALIRAAETYTGIKTELLNTMRPRMAEVPFDSARKLKTTVNMISGQPVAIVKGAPDIIFGRCTAIAPEAAEEANEALASRSLRVLAVAYKPLTTIPSDPSPEELEYNLTFAGLIGMRDPLLEDAKESVAMCEEAGIKTVLVTGDHLSTAVSVARELGILANGQKAVTSEELAAMDDAELDRILPVLRVCARALPEDKLRLTEAFRRAGETVAVTGGSIRDVPALKAADVGCAVGPGGTDVARGSADLILMDGHFSTAVEAVRTGRGIFDNIRKIAVFLTSCAFGEILFLLLSCILGFGLPLSAASILWINLLSGGMCAAFLGLAPAGRETMELPPTPRRRRVFTKRMLADAAANSLMLSLLPLAALFAGRALQLSSAGTLAFAVLLFSQLFSAIAFSFGRSLLRAGAFPKQLSAAAAAGILLTVLLLATPANALFGLFPLSGNGWLWAALLSFLTLPLSELIKLLLSALQTWNTRRHARAQEVI